MVCLTSNFHFSSGKRRTRSPQLRSHRDIAALATGLSPVISLCVAAVFLRRGKQGFHLARPTWAPGKLRLLMGPGLSAFINELSSGLVLAVLNWLMLKVAGNTGVAAKVGNVLMSE